MIENRSNILYHLQFYTVSINPDVVYVAHEELTGIKEAMKKRNVGF